MTILEKKGFISSKYRQFVMPSSQSNNPLSNIRSVNVCSFFVPSIVEISYKVKKCLRHFNSPNPSFLRGMGFSFASTCSIIFI